jgi:Lrp/AsnC family transcriptional regulator
MQLRRATREIFLAREMKLAKLDRLDLKLLQKLQSDASLSLAELAEDVALSSNACWKRVKRLEEEGFIERRVAILDRKKLGLGTTAFVTIRTDQHDDAWAEKFAAAIAAIPEVVEFYRMAGEVDYLLKVVCSGIEDYDRIYRKIIRTVKLRDVSGSFAMEQIKFTTEVPVECIDC